MPTAVKHILVFKDNSGYGWTESHWRNSSSDTPDLLQQLNTLATVIAPLRATMLGMDCQVVGARVSYPRADAVASLNSAPYLPGDADHPSASESISLAHSFVDATHTRKKIVHVRGFWDAVEKNGEYHPDDPAAAGWEARVIAWKEALIQNGYGWLSRDGTKSSRGRVTNYTSTPEGIITFTVGATLGLLPAVNSIIAVRFSRINNGKSPLNRTLMVRVKSATELETVDQVAAGPFVAPGRYNYRGTSFVGYTLLQKVTAGRRPAGAPLGQLPGRSKARAKY